MTHAIVLFGHGSRDPAWRAPMDAVAARIRQLSPGARVSCAFLEMQAPDLPEAVRQLTRDGATSICVLPMFLGVGRHAREDLPALAEQIRQAHPRLKLDVLPTVGESRQVIELLAALALEGAPSD